MTVTADNLNSAVEFDVPFRVYADGAVFTGPVPGVHAPNVWHDDVDDVVIDGTGWTTWSDGYTGQYGYRGPVMHASEQLAGTIASDLLAQPGTYVVTAVECLATDDDPEPEPAGWIILRLTA